MFDRLALGAALAAVLSTAAFAATPPKQVRDGVAAVLAKVADEELTDPDNPPTADFRTPPASMFKPVDINGDGKSDWQVDYGGAPVPGMWCGTGGCVTELWVSQPDNGGWAKVTEEQFREIRITRRNGVTRLDADFHGSVCGGYGAMECPRSYVWDENIGWVPVANLKGQTWFYGGPVELNLYERGSQPDEVVRAFEAIQSLCPPGGGADERKNWGAEAIPDINGDGRRDWVVGSSWATCKDEDDTRKLPVIVLTSDENGDLKEAYRAARIAFGIDIASTPAAFYAIPEGADCKENVPCGERLRWNGASGKLVK